MNALLSLPLSWTYMSRIAIRTSAAIHSVVAVDTVVGRAVAAMIAGTGAADTRVIRRMRRSREGAEGCLAGCRTSDGA